MIGVAVTVVRLPGHGSRLGLTVNGSPVVQYAHEDRVAAELHRLGATAPTSYDVIRRLADGARLVSVILPTDRIDD